MSSLEVVAAPVFEKDDLEWLMGQREARARSLGPPHFTLVFPGSDLAPHEFAAEVKSRAAGIQRIRFHLRCGLVVPDPQVRAFHVFLVPDEGFAAIVRLHDRLHEGKLAACLRPEMTYLPHITIASTREVSEARTIAAKLNAGGISIPGRIDALDVHRRDGETVRPFASVPLVKPGLFG
jgi:2'-5' RNA ligase